MKGGERRAADTIYSFYSSLQLPLPPTSDCSSVVVGLPFPSPRGTPKLPPPTILSTVPHQMFSDTGEGSGEDPLDGDDELVIDIPEWCWYTLFKGYRPLSRVHGGEGYAPNFIFVYRLQKTCKSVNKWIFLYKKFHIAFSISPFQYPIPSSPKPHEPLDRRIASSWSQRFLDSFLSDPSFTNHCFEEKIHVEKKKAPFKGSLNLFTSWRKILKRQENRKKSLKSPGGR